MLRWDLAEARKIAEEQRQFPREPCAWRGLSERAACALRVLHELTACRRAGQGWSHAALTDRRHGVSIRVWPLFPSPLPPARRLILFSLRAPPAPLRSPSPSRDLRVFDDESSGDCESVCSDDGECRALATPPARFAQLATRARVALERRAERTRAAAQPRARSRCSDCYVLHR
jgi:hypothetical protein